MKLGEASGLSRGQIWITERYERYVQHERDLEAERDALYRILTRPKRNRVGSFSASSAGSCSRYQQLQFLDMPKEQVRDPKTMKIFANGDYVHLRYQVAGLVGGWLNDVEVLFRNPNYRLIGTVDGINTEGDLVEFKSINSYGFSSVMSFGPQPKHVKQIQTYLFLSGASKCWLLYENKDTQDTKEFRVDRDETDIASLRASLEVVNEYTDRHELLPMLPECERKEGRYKWCEFRGVCPTAKWRTPSTSSSTPM